MERRVEARDLRQIGAELGEGPDRGQVVRLVERGEGDERVEIGQDLGVDRGRLAVLQAAVDDAVAHRVKPPAAQPRLDLGGPAEQVVDRAFVPQPGPLGPFGLGDGGPGTIAGEESGRCEQSLRLSAEQQLKLTGSVEEDGELQARRAGVQDGDGPVHGRTPVTTPDGSGTLSGVGRGPERRDADHRGPSGPPGDGSTGAPGSG